jgi:hypothetical protein
MARKSGAKVKKLKINNTNNEDMQDLQRMFKQITGSEDADRDIITPKITKIYKNIQEYNKLYSILLKFKAFTDQFAEYSFWFTDIGDFLKDLSESTGVDLTRKYDEAQSNYHTMPEAELNEFYKKLKENTYVKKMVITGSNLALYKKSLHDLETISDSFIYREPGITLQPLSFSTLDLKLIWNTEGFNDKAKKFVLSIMRHTYLIGIDMYDIITSPDVDIKKFSKILIDAISNMKKQIPRCDRAFAIIEKSVNMLEDNFKTYFRGSVEAQNPNVIIESFILDISTSQKGGASVAGEFRKIVQYLREKGSSNQDPKVQKLFGMLNSQFSSLDSDLGSNVKVTPNV